MTARSVHWLGIVCLGLALALGALAFPLGCAPKAARVGGFSLLDGALLGTFLALVTRTRRPFVIYLYLLGAALTFWPLLASWPPAGDWEVRLWPGAPDILSNYFDLLRPILFVLGIPYPFARFGCHAPDPLPPTPSVLEPDSPANRET